MANVGDRFSTAQRCVASGSYVFDGYTDGSSAPAPTQEERVISLRVGDTFPPIRSANKGAYWKLQRLA